MQKLKMALESRLHQEWQELDVVYPKWLKTLADDDLYYTVTLITVCANSFGLGLLVGWMLTL